jgi:hypothetical protein
MKSKLLFTGIILVALIAMEGCKKYPDGPSMTLRSKKDRLANEWVIQKVITNEVDVTVFWVNTYPDFLWNIRKDYYYELLTNGITTEGTWALDEEKEEIIFTENNSPTPEVYTIYKLKHNELWLYRVVGGDETEVHLTTKVD